MSSAAMTSNGAPVNNPYVSATPADEVLQTNQSQSQQKTTITEPERDGQREPAVLTKSDKDISVGETGNNSDLNRDRDRDNETVDFDLDFKGKDVDLEIGNTIPTDMKGFGDTITTPEEHRLSRQSLSQSPLHNTSLPSDDGASLLLTLLLTTGPRYPFRVAMGDLRKRDVQVTDDDPYQISIKMLKELILDGWRQGWFSAFPAIPMNDYRIANHPAVRFQNGTENRHRRIISA